MQVVTTIKKLNYNNLTNITRLYKIASSLAAFMKCHVCIYAAYCYMENVRDLMVFCCLLPINSAALRTSPTYLQRILSPSCMNETMNETIRK